MIAKSSLRSVKIEFFDSQCPQTIGSPQLSKKEELILWNLSEIAS